MTYPHDLTAPDHSKPSRPDSPANPQSATGSETPSPASSTAPPSTSPAPSSGTPGLADRFKHHPPPDEATAALHSAARGWFTALALAIDAKVPDGREKSLAFTNLEQSMFWTNAAIARGNAPKESA